jgi:hypothetical protein
MFPMIASPEIVNGALPLLFTVAVIVPSVVSLVATFVGVGNTSSGASAKSSFSTTLRELVLGAQFGT